VDTDLPSDVGDELPEPPFEPDATRDLLELMLAEQRDMGARMRSLEAGLWASEQDRETQRQRRQSKRN
jgi:hypothetical protein